MARRWYEDAGADDLNLFIDPQNFNRTVDSDRLAIIQEFQGLTDDARADIAIAKGFGDLASYDTFLADEADEIQDRLDYYDYQTRTQNITVMDGAWFTPEAVESFCGETGADVVGRSIDGSNSTFWRHTQDERHSVVYRLRGYPKKIGRIRFRYGGSAAIERLENIDVHAARSLSRIDDPANILETGINPTWPAGPSVWVEHTLAQKKAKAKYIKLLFDTAHSANTMRMREFAVWVETRDP